MIDINLIKWNQGVLEAPGEYYVLGNGINGIQIREHRPDGWVLKPGEQVIVYGEMTGSYRIIYRKDSGMSPDTLKKLHYGDVKKLIELHTVSVNGLHEVPLYLLVKEDGTEQAVWTNPASAAEHLPCEDFYEAVNSTEWDLYTVPAAKASAVKPAPKAKTAVKPAPKPEPVQPEPVVEPQPSPEPEPVQPEPVAEPQSLPADESVVSEEEASFQVPDGEALEDDDLPF